MLLVTSVFIGSSSFFSTIIHHLTRLNPMTLISFGHNHIARRIIHQMNQQSDEGRSQATLFPLSMVPLDSIRGGSKLPLVFFRLIVPHTATATCLPTQRRILQTSVLQKSLHHQNTSELLDLGLRARILA